MYYCKFVDPTTFNKKLACVDAKSYEEAEQKMSTFIKTSYAAKNLGITIKEFNK